MKFYKSLSGASEIVKWNFDGESLVHWAQELSFKGFRLEMLGAKFPYLLNGGEEGSFAWCPVRGKDLYLSFQILARKSESGKTRRFQAELDGEILGEFELDAFDENYYLFCSEDRIPFFGHRRVYLRVLEGDNVTVSSINFSITPVFPKENAIENLTDSDGKVRFTTVKSSVCKVTYNDVSYSDDTFCNCHAFDIPLTPGEKYTVYATDKDGNEISLQKTAVKPAEIKREKTTFYYPLHYKKRSSEKTAVKAFYPFEKEKVFNIEGCGICDKDKNRYPADVKVTSLWDDDSIKTVSIDAVVIPDGREYFLSSDAKYEGADFTEENIERITYLNIDGKRLSPEFTPWETEFSGNAKKVLSRVGGFDTPYDKLRISETVTSYSGIQGAVLEIGLENSFTQPRTVKVDSLYTEIKGENNEEKSIYQIDDIYADINGEIQKNRCEGFTDGLYIADFWQNYPQSLEVKKDKTVIGLMPALGYDEIYSAYTKEDRHKLIYYMENGSYRLHMGMRKLFTIGISENGDNAKALCETVFMTPDAQTIEKSEAFGRIICSNDYTKDFDNAINDGYNLSMKLREEKREYGMFNYGDWHGERGINWGNNEYDMPYGGLMQYLRTGDERYAELGLISAKHMEEIDFVRVHSDRDLSGLFYLHTPGHSYFYDGIPEDSWDDFNTHVGHQFTEGLTEWYKVTGNERFKTAVLRCADTLAKYYCRDFDFDSEREPAWAMLAMTAAYELTRDKKYVNACRILKDRVASKQDKASGAIKRLLDFSECDRKFLFGGKPFMCGILMSAMMRYYEISGDKEALDISDGLAHWLAYEMWDDEEKGFWYTDYLKMRNSHTYPANSMEIIEGLLDSYGRTGDRLLYTRAREAFLRATNLEYRTGDIGKTLAMRLRFAPTALKMLYDGQIKQN